VRPEEQPPAGGGRHRHRRRGFGPLGLALLVSVILGGFGAGAAFLPASLLGAPGSAGDTAGGGAGAAAPGPGELPGDARPALAGTPSADSGMAPGASTRPSASPTATPRRTPTKKSTPTVRRSPSKSSTGSTGGSGAGGTTQQQVIDIVNRERAAGGCGRVTANAKLTRASQLHSEDQAAHNTMSHDGSDGSSPWDRSKRAGYDNAIGENVAAGYRTASAVMDGWMNSPGHRNNIMNCGAKAIGVGVARSSGGTLYWTQMFGSVA
jgi:uncharacterized protein YkwD